MSQQFDNKWDIIINYGEEIINYAKNEKRREQLANGNFWPNASNTSFLGELQRIIDKGYNSSLQLSKDEIISLTDYRRINENAFKKIYPFVVRNFSSSEKKKFRHRIYYFSDREKRLENAKKYNKAKRQNYISQIRGSNGSNM
uniref:Uncharacterized protein n=1 Tax=viral metagenome TaxID=1070528 RepID=A0A6C0HSS2_9ZZZZ